MFSLDPPEVASRLLAWYARDGRELPWRGTRDLYRIWLSEIMLQQTTVAAVIPYYERFLERFPTVGALAAAPIEAVIELWAGLGYYSRARNLHAAARQVVSAPGGKFPDTLTGLLALPGVGRSTAGAIFSIAFDRKAPILDGNVRRVLCRLYALEDDPRSSGAEKRLWSWAEALTPEDRPHDYAQAIMDLGATVCTPRKPLCTLCPLALLCRACQTGREQELPVKRVRKAVPTEIRVALLVRQNGKWLVRRRPLAGLLGGLWEFPDSSVPAAVDPAQTAAKLLRELGWSGEPRAIGRVAHGYSHFRLDLHLFRVDPATNFRVAEGAAGSWFLGAELAALPLHGAHKKALAMLETAA